MPNYPLYHRSLTDELHAVKDRIRNLVEHWLTDGEWKEAALRTILRRHLADGILVGRGFIVGREYSSTQIDLLVLRGLKPTIFRDGDLVLVTPDAPGAIASVKTKLTGFQAWHEAALDLARLGGKCKEIANNSPWLGVFAYEGDERQGDNILNALCETYRETGVPINCVSCGPDVFVRFWPIGESEPGDSRADIERAYWRLYRLDHLAPAYFVGNLIDAVCGIDRRETDYAWFAHAGGKRPHMLAEKRLEECVPSGEEVAPARRQRRTTR